MAGQIRGGRATPMREPSLEPTPRRRLEKLFDSGIGAIVPPMLMFKVAFGPLSKAFGQ